MTFDVIPAIDLRGGQVVRLRQGDYAQETRYAQDPQEIAGRYADAGARWLHVVDLDGARSGDLANLAVIASLAKAGMHVQAGGGVRAEEDVQRLFDAGVSRVVVGSVAIRDPERVAAWLKAHGTECFTIALDTRQRDDRCVCRARAGPKTKRARSMSLHPGSRRKAHAICCARISIVTACWLASTWICTDTWRRAFLNSPCRRRVACARWTTSAPHATPARVA